MDIRAKGLNHLCFPTYYRGPFVASKYCESTPRSQVNLSHDSSQSSGRWPGMRTPSRLRSEPIRSASKYCESTTHPVYHAKITVSTKNFPRSEGRKCGVKGLVQWRGLMVWSRSWFRTTRPRHFKKFFACSGAFGENSPKVDPQFYRCPATMGNDWESSCHRWWGLLAMDIGQREG